MLRSGKVGSARASLLAVAAIVFAVAALAPSIVSRAERRRAVVVDRSASCSRREGWSWESALRAGAEGLARGDRWAVVVAAGRTRVVLPWSAWDGALPPDPGSEGLDPLESDLARAVAAARALDPGEIVLVSDGKSTTADDPRAAAGSSPLALAGAPGSPFPNATLTGVRAPREAPAGARIVLRVDVAASDGAGPESVELAGRAVPLRREESGRFSAEILATQPADRSFTGEVRLLPGDRFPEDDHAPVVVPLAGKLRVGLAGGAPAFVAALASRPEWELRLLPSGFKSKDLADLDAVVAIDVEKPETEAGLLVAGSERAFADSLGLPLVADPGERAPADLLVLVDASGSMAGAKLSAASAAALSLVAAAPADARLRAAFFAAKLEEPFDLRAPGAPRRLEEIRGSGATEVGAAIRAAASRFDRAGAKKRLFVVSDGLERGARAPLEAARACGEELQRAQVECTAIAVGKDADREFLAALTLDGRNGTALSVEDAGAIGAALRAEASRGESVTGGPVTALPDPSGRLALKSLPPVSSLARTKVRTGARALATVVTSEGARPLLAIDASSRVAALAVSPGSAAAPGYADLPQLFVPLIAAIARERPARRATLRGRELRLEDPDAGDVGLRVVRQGGRAWTLARAGPDLFRADAPGARGGWARIDGVPGSLFVEESGLLEASPLLEARALPGLASLPEPASGEGGRAALLAAGVIALVAAAAARKRIQVGPS